MNIGNNTKFIGKDLGKYKKRFEHYFNKKDNTRIKHIWFNEEEQNGVFNFITNLDDENEVAGTAIEVNNFAEVIYIAGIDEIGTNKL